MTTNHSATPISPKTRPAPLAPLAGMGLHPVVERLLQRRNFDREQISELLSSDLKKLPDLTKLLDMDKAALRLIQAIENGERIGVYGDYDVDGTTSCALLHYFFKSLDTEIEIFQPSRFIEGYGIHPPAIDKAISCEVKVLITVDCGITNTEAAEYALQRGLDLIITDHHKDAAEQMPPAYAVVNPNRRDEPVDGVLKPLAGVGVAFALGVRIRQLLLEEGKQCPSLYPLLQFVAIGTLCDLAPLTPVNLKLCRHGLKQIPNTQYAGIQMFFPPEERAKGHVPTERITFHVGPHINSKGRLDHPEVALKLLISETNQEAFTHFSQLEVTNRERKIIQGQVFKQAKENVLETISDEDLIITTPYHPEWHEGVIGIVASRLVETFKVPAIVFTGVEEKIDGKKVVKASARTAGDLDLFELLNQCSDLFIKFGGHKAAAGLSMFEENLASLRKKLSGFLSPLPAIERTVQDSYDLEIDFNEVNPHLVKQLETLEPFGPKNMRPVFKIRNVKLKSFDLMKDVHVRWHFTNANSPGAVLRGISFNYIGKWNTISPEEIFARQESENLEVLCCLDINRFRGSESIQLQVQKIVF